MNSGNIKRLFFPGIFLFLIALNVYKNRAMVGDADQPYDARNIFLAGKIWSKGQNPYNDSAIKAEWRVIALENDLNSRKEPGFPDCGMIYPFWSIPMLFPYYVISWSPLYRVLLIFFGLICIGFIAFFYRSSISEAGLPIGLVLGVLLSYKSAVTAIFLGQPMLPALMALTGSWLFYRKGKPVISGLFLGISMMKVTLSIPLIIFYIIRKRFSILWLGSMVPVLAGTVFFLVSGNIYLGDMLSNIHTQMELNYPGHRISAINTGLTEAGILANYFLNISFAVISNIQNIILLFLFISAWFLNRRRAVDDHWLLSFLVLSSLLLNYHLIYDGLILIVVFPVVYHSRIPWLWMVCLAPLFIPVNGLFRQIDWVQFHLPVTLFCLFLLNLYECRYHHQFRDATVGG